MLKISVMGVGRGVGTTHTAILAANVLSNGLGLKTALAEYNDRNHYMRIRREIKDTAGNVPQGEKCIHDFFYEGIHFYGNMLQRQPDRLYTSGYEGILLDMQYGEKKIMEEFLKSDIRIVMIGHNPWKIGEFRTFLKNERLTENACIFAAFGIGSSDVKKLKKELGICVQQIPIESNPFCISAHGFNEIMRILGQ
jgi:hypothetical protein